MIIHSAEFVISNKDLKKCPKPDKPEYAFIGRSNVGKSSLINMLVNKKHLAKTSSTPGKTQLINHFLIKSISDENLSTNSEHRTLNFDEWYLVDLPGMGYSRISKKISVDWERMIFSFFTHRKNLMNTFILVDSRHELQKTDIILIDWFGKNRLPFIILLTKTDKLSKLQLNNSLSNIQAELRKDWDELPPIIITSADNNIGREEILNFIEQTNKIFSF